MSFSNSVKKELSLTVTDKDKQFTCLYAILMFCKHFSKDEIIFQTESISVSELFPKLMEEVFGKINIKCEQLKRSRGNTLYSFLINDKESISRIISKYKIKPEARELNLINIANNSIGVFTAGVFLSCGSVIDPNKEYHLEFVIPNEQLYLDFSNILSSFNFGVKMITRKNSYVLYIKGSEEIEDMLTFMGAQQSTLELMNVKILKDVRNKANRIANCDSANIDKVIAASTRQINDIMIIQEKIGLDKLQQDLKEIAELRLENPELSLKEIGELLSKPLQRSGVNHRFKKIARIAEDLR